MCSKFQFVLIHLIMARIRKYNQTFKSNPIICLCIHSVYNTITWQETRLSSNLANSWYSSSKEKGDRGPLTVTCQMHSSSSNKIKFNFPAAMSLTRSSFNREIKLSWCFKSVDRQNRSMMPLSCWHFDNGWVIGEVMYDLMAN